MAKTFTELGQRINDLGMKFGVHAHLGSAMQTKQDVDAIMELTDPKLVYSSSTQARLRWPAWIRFN